MGVIRQPLARVRSQGLRGGKCGAPDGAGLDGPGVVEGGDGFVVADGEGVELCVGAGGGGLGLAEVDGFGAGAGGAEEEVGAGAGGAFEGEAVVGGVDVRDNGGDGTEAGGEAGGVEGEDELLAVADAGGSGAALQLEGGALGGGCDVEVGGAGELAVEIHGVGEGEGGVGGDVTLQGEGGLLDGGEAEVAAEDDC